MKNSVLCYLEETAVKFPDKLAISDGELSVTFSEWRQRALCLACLLYTSDAADD